MTGVSWAEWAELLVDAAGVKLAQHVLDVGCGTGIVARKAAERVGRLGKVTGLDLEESMLTVARRQAPRAAWHEGDATDMPFADGVFDVVLCQASLVLFSDRVGALREMDRVAHSNGTLGVQVFGESPGHELAAEALEEIAGEEEAAIFRTPFILSDTDALASLFAEAGLAPVEIRSLARPARYRSLEEFARTEIDGRMLSGRVDGDEFLEAVRHRLEPFVADDGTLEIPMEGHIATVSKGRGR